MAVAGGNSGIQELGYTHIYQQLPRGPFSIGNWEGSQVFCAARGLALGEFSTWAVVGCGHATEQAQEFTADIKVQLHNLKTSLDPKTE